MMYERPTVRIYGNSNPCQGQGSSLSFLHMFRTGSFRPSNLILCEPKDAANRGLRSEKSRKGGTKGGRSKLIFHDGMIKLQATSVGKTYMIFLAPMSLHIHARSLHHAEERKACGRSRRQGPQQVASGYRTNC